MSVNFQKLWGFNVIFRNGRGFTLNLMRTAYILKVSAGASDRVQGRPRAGRGFNSAGVCMRLGILLILISQGKPKLRCFNSRQWQCARLLAGPRGALSAAHFPLPEKSLFFFFLDYTPSLVPLANSPLGHHEGGKSRDMPKWLGFEVAFTNTY